MHKVIGVFLAVVFAAGVLVLAPNFWNGRDAYVPRYGFTEADMRAAAEGTWKLELTRKLDGKPAETHRLTFAVVQASRAYEPIACGKRTLVRNAHACYDSTTMPLQIVLYELPLPVRGRLEVVDNDWELGFFHVKIGSIEVRARMSKEGELRGVDASEGYSATLTRIARR